MLAPYRPPNPQAKAIFITLAADLDAYPRVQAMGMLAAAGLVWWWNTRKVGAQACGGFAT